MNDRRMKFLTEPFKRIHIIILDSVGIGEAPDAAEFDDIGADTLGHIAREKGGLNLPNLGNLGLSNIRPIQGVDAASVTARKLRNDAGKISWKRYDDRSLGNHGIVY